MRKVNLTARVKTAVFRILGSTSPARFATRFGFAAILLLLAGFGAGCRTTGGDKAAAVARFFLENDESGGIEMVLPLSEARVPVSPKPVITEYDIVNVEVVRVDLGRCLLFQLTPAAGRDLYRLSASNRGRRLVLLVNGVPLGARVMDVPIEAGELLIFVERPEAALPELVAELKASARTLQKAAQR